MALTDLEEETHHFYDPSIQEVLKTLILFFEGQLVMIQQEAHRCHPASANYSNCKAEGKPYNPIVVQDLQPVKTYVVFSVYTASSAATFPQLHTKKPPRPSVVRAAVEKQNPLASFT